MSLTHLAHRAVSPACALSTRRLLRTGSAAIALLAMGLLAGCGDSEPSTDSFEPESTVSVSDNTPGATADLTVTTTLSKDQPLLRSQVLQIPDGWTINDTPDGDVAGSGSLRVDVGCDGSEESFDFDLVRQEPPSDTELTAWSATMPQLIDLLFRVEARTSGGYDVSVTFPWEFSPEVVACTPDTFAFTVNGNSSSGAPLITNPEQDGAYNVQLDLGTQPLGQSSVRRACVSIGEAVCPTASSAGSQ